MGLGSFPRRFDGVIRVWNLYLFNNQFQWNEPKWDNISLTGHEKSKQRIRGRRQEA
jgi:hypothetical protein